MSESVIIEGNIGYMAASGSAVFFSKGNGTAGGAFVTSSAQGTAVPVREMQNALEVVSWGEDNRFPQNIEDHMSFCSIGKAALSRGAKKLFGGGVRAGKVIDYNDDGSEVFQLIKPTDATQREILDFLKKRTLYRFWLEYLLDWKWFANCFPEAVLSYDGKKITDLVHQESCDARYKNMNEYGLIETVYLSKLWGLSKTQYPLFDPERSIKGLLNNPTSLQEVDNKFVQALDCIDPYDPINSLRRIADKQLGKRGIAGYKSAILPVFYPSPNKPYYQVPVWDGSRKAGWTEIAAKVPAIIKKLYENAFRLKYLIQVPETYMEKIHGIEAWNKMDEKAQRTARKRLLTEMNDYLTGVENAYKSFLNFYDSDPRTGKEYGLVKIEQIKNESTVDKELMTSSSANVEILMSMEEHPSTMSAGGTGDMYRNGGGSGSDIREAGLDSRSLLFLERQVLLEPLYLVRDFNGWDPDVEFRFVDTKLTTLDKGKGTEKVVS